MGSVEAGPVGGHTRKIDPPGTSSVARTDPSDANAIVGTEQAQDEPALFLTDAERLAAMSHEFLRQAVAQPVIRETQDLDVAFPEPDFLQEFAIHRFPRAFSFSHSALWKLPAFTADATS